MGNTQIHLAIGAHGDLAQSPVIVYQPLNDRVAALHQRRGGQQQRQGIRIRTITDRRCRAEAFTFYAPACRFGVGVIGLGTSLPPVDAVAKNTARFVASVATLIDTLLLQQLHGVAIEPQQRPRFGHQK